MREGPDLGYAALVTTTVRAQAAAVALVIWVLLGPKLHDRRTFPDHRSCERALAAEVAGQHAMIDLGLAPGWRAEKLPNGRRDYGPSGEVTTDIFLCMIQPSIPYAPR